MIDGLLFILIIINFAITITLYIRYSKNDQSELRDELVSITNKFNRDAERNIQILEDRIKVLDSLLKRSEIKSADTGSKVSLGSKKGKASKLNSVFEAAFANNSKTTRELPEGERSYVQRAYGSPSPTKAKNEVSKDEGKGTDDLAEEGVVDVVKNLGKNKDKSHRIARFIGEGKSYEEIANILGMSLGEIQLFASILRKKIRGK